MATIPVQALTTVSQWLACAHANSTLLPAGADARGVGVVAVAARDDGSGGGAGGGGGNGPAVGPAGLVIGPNGLAYHSVPEAGTLDRLSWDPFAARSSTDVQPVLAPPIAHAVGQFATADPPDPQLRAVSLALDPADEVGGSRLLALDAGGDLVALNLASRRLVRRLRLVAPAPDGAPWTAPIPSAQLRPVDLAAGRDAVLIACHSRAHPLWRLSWHGDPVEMPVPSRTLVGLPAGAVPLRVAADPTGRVWLLWHATGQPAWATPVVDERTALACGPLPGATDIELDGDGDLIVAFGPGADLRVFTIAAGALTEDRPLRARRADGRGITRTPDGQIACWTAAGIRTTHGAPQRYRSDATLFTTALDSGVFRQRWGRLFVDACVPPGTSVTIGFLTSDDLPGDELDGLPPALGEAITIAATRPVNVLAAGQVMATGLPLPPVDAPVRFGPDRPLYRRGVVEQPWLRVAGDDTFVTYEAPVNAPPGRYLWLRVHLQATGLRTPRVRAIRVETAGPKLVERLPRVYSEDADSAAFLDRYLKLLNGPLGDLGAAADARHVLLDPGSAPAQMLPWLASLVGLVLDARWPETARRAMIAQAVPLFRRRGTIGALLTMLRIVLGVTPVLVERYAFRGLNGSVGTVLHRTGTTFEQYAHRFSVVIPGSPTADQLAMVTDLLTVHRPAHTLFEICSARTGARIGIGLHLGLTSVIGRGSGWSELAVGGVLGRDAVLGRAEGGVRVGSGAIGLDARVEP